MENVWQFKKDNFFNEKILFYREPQKAVKGIGDEKSKLEFLKVLKIKNRWGFLEPEISWHFSIFIADFKCLQTHQI